MKFFKINEAFAVIIGLVLITSVFSCTDDDVFELEDNTVTFSEFGVNFEEGGSVLGTFGTFDTDGNYGEFDLRLVDETFASYRILSGGAAPGTVGVNITHNQSGSTGSVGSISSFPAEQTITFQEALDATGLSAGDVSVGDSFSVTFDVPGFDNGTTFAVGVIESGVVFRSALEGAFNAVAVNTNQAAGITWDGCEGNTWEGVVKYEAQHTDPEGTGEYIVLSTDEAGADNEDMSHGGYYPCYNSDAASLPLGDLRLTDVDGKLAIVGASQWGEVYTLSNVTPAGATLSFNWSNDYGEGAMITLTRTDGTEWPDNLTN